MNEILVTSYSDPDLDGTACSVGYSEFLRKRGRKAEAGIFGEPDEEAKFVLEKLGLNVSSSEDLVGKVDEIVLVDASNLEWLDETIDEFKISEMIDHREHNLSENFEADSQIELVGAAATLIAEKFIDSEVEISPESAELLYAAIADNTVDFQANVTTERDVEAAEWLKEKFSDSKVKKEIFKIKSDLDRPVADIVENDYYNTDVAGSKVGVAQIEALGVEEFIEENLGEILEKLRSLKQEENLDYVFLTSVDIEKGFNIFLAPRESRKILEKALDVEFKDGMAGDSRMLLRKEIIPKVKEELEKN